MNETFVQNVFVKQLMDWQRYVPLKALARRGDSDEVGHSVCVERGPAARRAASRSAATTQPPQPQWLETGRWVHPRASQPYMETKAFAKGVF